MVISAGVFATPAYAANELINEPYEYPVVPGTEEWAELMSFPEKIEVCKIPEGKVEAMSTEALIETILNHPLWIIYFAYDMDVVYDIYCEDIIVALQELEQREDADELLLKRYQTDQVAPMSVNNAEDSQGSKSDFLEILLAQPVFYDNLDKEELSDLDKEVSEKANIRSAGEGYVKVSPFYSILIEKQSLNKASRASKSNIKTPNGSTVPADDIVDDGSMASASDVDAAEDYFERTFPSAVQLGPATNWYNCHSYAWIQRSKNNKIWLKDPSIYWEDDSYIEFSPQFGSTVPAETRVLFYNYKYEDNLYYWHSVYVIGKYPGTVIGSSTNLDLCKVESKWGAYGLYQHRLLDHPYTRRTPHAPDNTNYDMAFYKRA